MKAFIVWNENRTEGFVTLDYQLAYEVRKCSDTNCYDDTGVRASVAIEFINRWGDENLTIQEVDL